MASVEEHLRRICGTKDFEIAALRAAVDKLQEDLDALKPPEKAKTQVGPTTGSKN